MKIQVLEYYRKYVTSIPVQTITDHSTNITAKLEAFLRKLFKTWGKCLEACYYEDREEFKISDIL